MYYESGTVAYTANDVTCARIASGKPVVYAAAGAGRTLRMRSPDGSTFLREMMP